MVDEDTSKETSALAVLGSRGHGPSGRLPARRHLDRLRARPELDLPGRTAGNHTGGLPGSLGTCHASPRLGRSRSVPSRCGPDGPRPIPPTSDAARAGVQSRRGVAPPLVGPPSPVADPGRFPAASRRPHVRTPPGCMPRTSKCSQGLRIFQNRPSRGGCGNGSGRGRWGGTTIAPSAVSNRMADCREFVASICQCCGVEMPGRLPLAMTDSFRPLPECPQCGMQVCPPCRQHHVRQHDHAACDRMRVTTR